MTKLQEAKTTENEAYHRYVNATWQMGHVRLQELRSASQERQRLEKLYLDEVPDE